MTLAIYGPGGFGRELAAFARLQREVVFISDSADEVGRRVNDIPVYDFEALANNSDWEVVMGTDRHPWFIPPADVDPARTPIPSNSRAGPRAG